MKRPNSRERGFALIEVMVSLVIFSLGVIGLIGMQSRALQLSTDSQDRNTAAMLVNNLSSQMWIGKTTSLGAAAIDAWKAQVQAALPNATTDVNSTSATTATITLKWKSPSRLSADAPSEFSTTVVIPQ